MALYKIGVTEAGDAGFVCDFEDVSEVLKPACHQCKSKASCLSLVGTGSMNNPFGGNIL